MAETMVVLTRQCVKMEGWMDGWVEERKGGREGEREVRKRKEMKSCGHHIQQTR